MPLSEHEQRLLDEMERELYQHDASFAAKVDRASGQRARSPYQFVVLGSLLALAGIAVLISGVVLKLALIGVLGFIVMFAGVVLAFTRPKRTSHQDATNPASDHSTSHGSKKTNSGFMDRMNDRWDKRQHGQDS